MSAEAYSLEKDYCNLPVLFISLVFFIIWIPIAVMSFVIDLNFVTLSYIFDSMCTIRVSLFGILLYKFYNCVVRLLHIA